MKEIDLVKGTKKEHDRDFSPNNKKYKKHPNYKNNEFFAPNTKPYISQFREVLIFGTVGN